ncbi:MAG TPA: antitoxin [Dermatophilaceae bacterium]|nr:antitoxin [Dermatophilaceae bacterium]
MGLFDEMKDKATDLIQGNSDKVDDAVEKAGDLLDEKTGGQFSDKVDMAQEKAKEIADGLDQAN